MAIGLHDADAKSSPSLPRRGRLQRVLYALALDPGLKFGSMEEQLVLLAEAFRREQGLFLPLFICDPKASLEDFRGRAVAAECLDLRQFGLSTLMALRRLVRRERIDVVHWNFSEPLTNGYLWGLSVLCPGVRHWFTDHNSRLLPPPPASGPKRLVKKLLLKRYRRVVCVSRYVKQGLEDQGVWSNLIAQTHFINTARFIPDGAVRATVRSQLGADNHFVLLVVGQLISEKGVDLAIEALACLPAHVVLWIIGAGPQERQLAVRIAELGLGDRVRMLGLQANVQPFCQAADAFICPSIWAEAAGLVNLEAQACGVPVVASRIGGIPEYVVDGRTGLFFEPGDSAGLARQLRRLIDEPELRRTMSAQARAWALEQFSFEARLPGLFDLYRKGI